MRTQYRNDPVMDPMKREKLLSASTSGRNETGCGLIGKLRAFFEPVEDAPMALDFYPEGVDVGMVWSLCDYEKQVAEAVEQNREDAAEKWDELEKSVIKHLADEVKVRVRSREVEMTIYKKLA